MYWLSTTTGKPGRSWRRAREARTGRVGPVRQPLQAGTPGGVGAAVPVVAYLDGQRPPGVPDGHRREPGAAVLVDVDQRLADHVVRGGLGRQWQAPVEPDVRGDRYRRAAGEL